MICASGSSADMVGRRKKEEEGDVFVELNHLMAVELMLLCILREGREGGKEGGREGKRREGREGRKGVSEGGREGKETVTKPFRQQIISTPWYQ